MAKQQELQELEEASSGAGAGHTDKNWASLLSSPDLYVQAHHPSARCHHHAQQSAPGAAADQLSEGCPDLRDQQCEEVLELCLGHLLSMVKVLHVPGYPVLAVLCFLSLAPQLQ